MRKGAMDNGQVGGSSRTSFDNGIRKRFLVGEPVEVRQVEKGLQGSWHAAVVVELHKGKRTVEYEELLENDGVSKLRETVSVGKASDGVQLMATLPLTTQPRRFTRPLLRPRPPAPLTNADPLTWTKGFSVECFTGDAWWEGVLLEDVAAQITSTDSATGILLKSSVEVRYPEIDDTTREQVQNLRVGQEWDEDTGHWNLRGWGHVYQDGRPKKRGKPNSRRKQQAVREINTYEEQHRQVVEEIPAVINELPPTVMNAENDMVGVDVLEMEMLDQIVNGFSDQNLPGVDAVIPPCLGDEAAHPLENNSSGEQFSKEPTPLPSEVSASDMDEANGRKFLTDANWKVTKSRKKSAGKVNWTYRSPKDNGVNNSFFTLTDALKFENDRRSAQVNICQEIISAPISQREIEKSSPTERNFSRIFEADPKEVRFGEAEELGTSFLRDQKNEAPREHSNQDYETAKESKIASVLGFQGDPKDSLGPSSYTISEETPHTDVSPAIHSPRSRNYSDLDDEHREVNIITTRKRALVDPGQTVMWSSSNTPEQSPHFETAFFGAVSDLMEEADVYILRLYTAGYSKEQVKLILQNGELFLKTKYSLDKTLDSFSIRYNGALSSRVVLPKDVEYRSITAKLKDRTLIVTVPKMQNLAREQIEIEIL